ncbi:MAG: hypothetical protein IT438_08205 [Phycisphaerales bacterium]|nr:hypothetical protein [Phycisphaerales bacterium]
MQWSTHYWDRVDTGNKAKVGDFAFSNAALNNPLFNPVRAVRPTLEQVNLVSASDCDGMAALQPGWGNTAIADAFRDAMKHWKISTDSAADPSGTATHVGLISGSGVGWTSQGNLIISDKLPWSPVSGTNAAPTAATSISSSTQAAINKLITVGSIIASASAGTSEAQSLITGEESHATRFERGVRETLAGGGWQGDTWRVDAVFGVFGSLPLVGVMFGDAYVLLDSTNGNIDGPFALTSVLSPDSLLAAHSQVYSSGSAVEFYSGPGCATTVAARWRNTFCMFCTVPPITWTPPPPGMAYFCFTTGQQSDGSIGCTCERHGTLVYGTPPVTYRVREVCDCGTGAATPCATGWVALPPTPPCTVPPCPTQYWY